jgi:hypothetical protein
MTKGWDMKKLLRYCGLVAIAGAALYLPNCDDEGPGPAPYTGPWKIVPCPEGPSYLKGVFFVNPALGYAVGCRYILKYDGSAWEVDHVYPIEEGKETAGFNDVWFNDPDDGWVVGDWGDGKLQKGLIAHYDGVKWTEVENIPESVWWECVFFLDKNNGWVGGYGISRWDGSRWHYESEVGFITGLYFNSPTDGWAVSKYSESIYHYDGTTWTRVHDDPWGIELYSVWFTSLDHGWAGGSRTISEAQSCLMEYKNGKWSYYQLPDRRSGINALHFSSPANGWAVEQSTFRWDGERWWHVKRPPPETRTGTLFDVFTIDENDAWAVGDGRTIFHYEP